MNQGINEINQCEVCGNLKLNPVLNLGQHPMCDDLIPVGDMRICREYPIDILYCADCDTAHQRFQVAKHELFPATYHYRSRFTADVLNGMQNLVEGCEQRFGELALKKIIDIGCNDGSLLSLFREKGGITIGIEPTDAADEAMNLGHVIYKDYLSEAVASKIVESHGYPDFITFTNVFAHIEALDGVLSALKVLMSESTILVIENHYLGAILEGNQFDTFYHEHPRTYSFGSFVRMAKRLNAKILDVNFPSRYGGNIRIFIGSSIRETDLNQTRMDALAQRESTYGDAFEVLQKNIECWKHKKSKQITSLVEKYGPLRAKAFPGRAAILVKLLGLNETIISAVYEKPGSLKIGHYLPGTRIPICSDDELFASSVKTLPIINFAWHIPQEIRTYLQKNNYSGNVIDILSNEDFISE